MTSSAKRRGDQGERDVAKILDHLLGTRVRRKLDAGCPVRGNHMLAATQHDCPYCAPRCDSCGCVETEDNEFVSCTEGGYDYLYCEGCYAP